MHRFNERRDYLKSRITTHLSHFGIANICDYVICNRVDGNFPYNANVDEECLESLANNARLYISALIPNINEVVQAVVDVFERRHVKVRIYILCEPFVPEYIVNALLPYSTHMFLVNNYYDHPNIHNMPIGIRDGEEVFPEHAHFSGNILLNEGEQLCEKKYLCLLCFTGTHVERNMCENQLGKLPFVENLNAKEWSAQPSYHCRKVPVWVNYQMTHESYYTLSPSGLGQATHRFFEAIYLNSTPIVKRTNTAFDKMYNVFPCLVVDEWSDITQELLESKKDECQMQLRVFKEKYPDLYVNVENLEELMLQM